MDPMRSVVRRELIDNESAQVAIRDHLECGHTFQRKVSNSGNYGDYNPAKRRRCEECGKGS